MHKRHEIIVQPSTMKKSNVLIGNKSPCSIVKKKKKQLLLLRSRSCCWCRNMFFSVIKNCGNHDSCSFEIINRSLSIQHIAMLVKRYLVHDSFISSILWLNRLLTFVLIQLFNSSPSLSFPSSDDDFALPLAFPSSLITETTLSHLNFFFSSSSSP